MTPTSLIMILLFVVGWSVCIYCNTTLHTGCDFTILILISVLLFFAYCCEFMDLFCPKMEYNCKDCGDGNGSGIVDYNPTSTTSKPQAIQNIKDILDRRQKFVTWRKSLIISSLLVLILCMFKRNLNVTDVFALMFMFFVIVTFMQTFYNYHYDAFIVKTVKNNLDVVN